MLKRRDRIERLDIAIEESEQAITEQVFRILAMEARGEDTRVSLRTLRAFEDLLVEFRKMRKAMVEARKLIHRSPPSLQD